MMSEEKVLSHLNSLLAKVDFTVSSSLFSSKFFFLLRLHLCLPDSYCTIFGGAIQYILISRYQTLQFCHMHMSVLNAGALMCQALRGSDTCLLLLFWLSLATRNYLSRLKCSEKWYLSNEAKGFFRVTLKCLPGWLLSFDGSP